ncbi:hypothetical protein HDF16_000503 [Granulicella aggregans]|uniref:DUF6434 domain-containing protein n=1 Tax=Granulicella aggregans TaxID=474949 RepID=A0A7W8E256_9BACT|nr:hypothetical protein [Granulicella aggregans]
MQSATRPRLTDALTSEDFLAWYWLKEELIAFAREHGISTVGLKREVEARIAAYLSGAIPSRHTATPKRPGSMPAEFALDTVIGEGWRCGPILGRFFRQELGSGFHFNAEIRDFIHNGTGKTLAEAAICYQNSVTPGHKRPAIPEQLEYNRHFREFFAAHPGATRVQAIAAWWDKRGSRRM